MASQCVGIEQSGIREEDGRNKNRIQSKNIVDEDCDQRKRKENTKGVQKKTEREC